MLNHANQRLSYETGCAPEETIIKNDTRDSMSCMFFALSDI